MSIKRRTSYSPSSSPHEENTSLSVCLRIRPPPTNPLQNAPAEMSRRRNGLNEIQRVDGSVVWRWNSTQIMYQESPDRDYYASQTAQQYGFTRVFGMDASTKDVYDVVAKPVVQRTYEGYNCCIFAYGQTNSGKTYTMSGTPDAPGIISLAASDFFGHIQRNLNCRSLLRVAFLEVYNEQLKDLLVDKQVPLNIKDDPERGCTIVVNLTEKVVSSLSEVLLLASQGEKRRAFGCNNIHEHASRSHTLFQLIFESRREGEAQVRVSTLNIVDLAGSELAFNPLDSAGGMSMAENGVWGPSECKLREREGANIRKSLLALSRVVESLAKPNSESVHIPYRDSKLTRILQTALGGNSTTAMIATINPWLAGVDDRQTAATLRFATMAQKVSNRPQKVNLISPEKAELEKREEELRLLREKIAEEKTAHHQDLNVIEKLEQEKNHMKHNLTKQEEETLQLKQRYKNLEKFILTSKTLKGQDLTVLNGIGLDEEMERSERKSKSHSSSSKSRKHRKSKFKRSSSFCCVRDSDSKSLFGLVDKEAITGRVIYKEIKHNVEFIDELSLQATKRLKQKIEELQSQLQTKDQFINELRCQQNNDNNKYKELLITIQKLQNEIQDEQQKHQQFMVSSKEESRKKDEMLDKLSIERLTLEKNLEEKTKEVEINKERQLKRIDEITKDLNTMQQRYIEHSDQLRNELQAREAELVALRRNHLQELDTLRRELSTSQQTVLEMKHSLKSSEMDNNEIKERFNKDLETAHNQITNIQNHHNRILTQMENEINIQKEENRKLAQQQQENLHKNLESQSELKILLKTKEHDLSDKTSLLNQLISSYRADIHNRSQGWLQVCNMLPFIEAMTPIINGLQTISTQTSIESEDRNDIILQIRNCETASASVHSWQYAALDQLRGVIGGLIKSQQGLNDLENIHIKQEIVVNELKREIENLKYEIEQKNSEINTFKTIQQDHISKIQSLEDELGATITKRDECLSEINEMRLTLNSKENEISNLVQCKDKQKSEIDELLKQMGESRELINRKNQEREVFQRAIGDLANEKAAWESYYVYKKSTRRFSGIREAIAPQTGKPKPWLRFLPTETLDDRRTSSNISSSNSSASRTPPSPP